MRALVDYDSQFGNTAKVAQTIGEALGDGADVTVARVGDVQPGQLSGVDLLIVGSPTHGGWFTEAIKGWLDQLPAAALPGIRAAVFDTRTPPTILSRTFGFAAPRIAKRLEKTGAMLVGEPGGFIVEGIKGPLKEGELERAAGWAREIAAAIE